MMAKLDAVSGVDVYRVGALHDLWHLYRMVRVGQFRQAATKARWLWRRRQALLARRSYWNGFLAETDSRVPRCGHGWTRKRALASLHRAAATTHWARHNPCGTVRLACDETRYCVTCDTNSRDWTVVEPIEVAP